MNLFQVSKSHVARHKEELDRGMAVTDSLFLPEKINDVLWSLTHSIN